MGPTADRFVERSAELAVLERRRADAELGTASVVLVRGEAGIGKTRLLREFTGRVGHGSVLWGGCLPSGDRGLPLAAFIQAFRGQGVAPSEPRTPTDLDSLLFGPSVEPVDGLTTRTQLFRAVLDQLDGLAGAAPTVLVIEDLHWADPSTRDLIEFIVPNLRSQRLLIVASYRPDDAGQLAETHRFLAELARHPHVTTMDVPPFRREQVRAKLDDLVDGEVPVESTINSVLDRTGGNPYFIEELVAADRMAPGEVPESLRELLIVGTRRVTPTTKRMLRVASLVEQDVEDWLIASAVDEPIDVVRDALHEAIDAGLLSVQRGNVVFRHALLQETLRDDLLVAERNEVHRAFAEAIDGQLGEDRARRAERTAQLAFHAHGAGDEVAALRAWMEAADAAESLFAFAEAHRHLAQAIAVWDAADGAAVTNSTLTAVLSRAAEDAFLGGSVPDACALLERAIAATASDDAVALGARYERLASARSAIGDRDGAMDAIVRADELMPETPPTAERARVLAGMARLLMYRGRLTEARRSATASVETSRHTGTPGVEADALATLGAVNFYLGEIPTGLAQLAAAGELAAGIGDAHQQMRSVWNLATCHAEAGDFEESLRLRHAAIAEFPRLGHGHMLPKLTSLAGTVPRPPRTRRRGRRARHRNAPTLPGLQRADHTDLAPDRPGRTRPGHALPSDRRRQRRVQRR